MVRDRMGWLVDCRLAVLDVDKMCMRWPHRRYDLADSSTLGSDWPLDIRHPLRRLPNMDSRISNLNKIYPTHNLDWRHIPVGIPQVDCRNSLLCKRKQVHPFVVYIQCLVHTVWCRRFPFGLVKSETVLNSDHTDYRKDLEDKYTVDCDWWRYKLRSVRMSLDMGPNSAGLNKHDWTHNQSSWDIRVGMMDYYGHFHRHMGRRWQCHFHKHCKHPWVRMAKVSMVLMWCWLSLVWQHIEWKHRPHSQLHTSNWPCDRKHDIRHWFRIQIQRKDSHIVY